MRWGGALAAALPSSTRTVRPGPPPRQADLKLSVWQQRTLRGDLLVGRAFIPLASLLTLRGAGPAVSAWFELWPLPPERNKLRGAIVGMPRSGMDRGAASGRLRLALRVELLGSTFAQYCTQPRAPDSRRPTAPTPW